MSVSYSSMASSLQPKLVKAQNNLNSCLEVFNKGYAVNGKVFCDEHLRRCISYIKMSQRLLDKNSVDLNDLGTSAYKKTNVAINLCVDEKSFITGMNYLYVVQSFIASWGNTLDTFYSENEKDNFFAENPVIKSLYYDLKKVYQMFVLDFNDIISVAENARSYIVENNDEINYIQPLEDTNTKIESLHEGKLTLSDVNYVEHSGDKKENIKEAEIDSSSLDYIEYLEAEIEKIESLDANEITSSDVDYYANIKIEWCNSKLAEYDISIPDFTCFEWRIRCGIMSFEEAEELLFIKCSNETKKLENSTFTDEVSYLEQENESLGWYKTYYKLLSVYSSGEEKASYDNFLAALDEKKVSNNFKIDCLNNDKRMEAFKTLQEEMLANLENGTYDYYDANATLLLKEIEYYEEKKGKLTFFELESLLMLKEEYANSVYKASLLHAMERNKNGEISSGQVYYECFNGLSSMVLFYRELLEMCDTSSDDYKKIEAELQKVKDMQHAYYVLYDYTSMMEKPKYYLEPVKEYEAIKLMALSKQKVGIELSDKETEMINGTYSCEQYVNDAKKVGGLSFLAGNIKWAEDIFDLAVILSAGEAGWFVSKITGDENPVLVFAAKDLISEGYEYFTRDVPDLPTLENLGSFCYSIGTLTGSMALTLGTAGLGPIVQGLILAASTGGATYNSAIDNGADYGAAANASVVSAAAAYGLGYAAGKFLGNAANPKVAMSLKAIAGYSLAAGFTAAGAPFIGGVAEYLAVNGGLEGASLAGGFEYFNDNNVWETIALTFGVAGGGSFLNALYKNPAVSSLYQKYFKLAGVPEAEIKKYAGLSAKETLQLEAFGRASIGDLSLIGTARIVDSIVTPTIEKLASTAFCVTYYGINPKENAYEFLDKILENRDMIKSGLGNINDFLKKYAVNNFSYLPAADSYLSDDFIVDYVKAILPLNNEISRVNDLASLANELSKGITEKFITFQTVPPSSSNTSSNEKYNSSTTISVSWLKAHASEYEGCYKFVNNELVIENYSLFGLSVLGTVDLASVKDIYMIESEVPLNGNNIRIPSVLDGTADITSILPFTGVTGSDSTVIYPFVSLPNFNINLNGLGVDNSTGITYEVKHVSISNDSTVSKNASIPSGDDGKIINSMSTDFSKRDIKQTLY